MARKIARQRQVVHQRFQRQRLMLLRLQRRGRDLPHKLDDAMARVDLPAQRQRIDEEPDQILQFRAAAVGQRRADHDIVLPL